MLEYHRVHSWFYGLFRDLLLTAAWHLQSISVTIWHVCQRLVGPSWMRLLWGRVQKWQHNGGKFQTGVKNVNFWGTVCKRLIRKIRRYNSIPILLPLTSYVLSLLYCAYTLEIHDPQYMVPSNISAGWQERRFFINQVKQIFSWE